MLLAQSVPTRPPTHPPTRPLAHPPCPTHRQVGVGFAVDPSVLHGHSPKGRDRDLSKGLGLHVDVVGLALGAGVCARGRGGVAMWLASPSWQESHLGAGGGNHNCKQNGVHSPLIITTTAAVWPVEFCTHTPAGQGNMGAVRLARAGVVQPGRQAILTARQQAILTAPRGGGAPTPHPTTLPPPPHTPATWSPT